MGTYFLAFSLVTFGSVVSSVGIAQVAVRYVARSIGLDQYAQARWVVGRLMVVGLLAGLCSGFAYLFFGSTLGEEVFQAPALVATTGLVAGWIVATSLQILLAETFRGFHDIRSAVTFGGSASGGGLVAGTVLIICLSFLLLLGRHVTLSMVLAISAASGITSALLAGWVLRRKVASFPRMHSQNQVTFAELLRAAWPLMVTQLIIIALTQADIWILAAFVSEKEVAIYGAAARVVLLTAMPLQVANVVVEPLVAEMYAQGRKQTLERMLRATATLAGAPSLLVVLALVLAGGLILDVIYGEFYRAGAVILVLLSLGQAAVVWTGSCGTTLAMTGHQWRLMTIVAICGIITVVAELLVAARYGAVGVAVIAAGGLALKNIAMLVATRYTTGMWTHISFALLPRLVKEAARDR
jgi:O-antigen/teichoic acid export membrane protein